MPFPLEKQRNETHRHWRRSVIARRKRAENPPQHADDNAREANKRVATTHLASETGPGQRKENVMLALLRDVPDKAGGRAPAPAGENSQPGAQGPSGRARLGALASLVINFVLPLAAYELLRPHVARPATALALAGAIPVGYTLAVLAVRRRLDPVGVVGVVSFGVGVLISWACGGNTLAIELQDPAVTGPLGIACLVSVAIGRPLHPVIRRLLGRGNSRYTDIASRAQHRTSMVTTTVIGLTLLGHAIALAVLALTQSTGTFVALQHAVGLPIFAVGIGGLYLYRHRRAEDPGLGSGGS
jgi:hypothetical protein